MVDRGRCTCVFGSLPHYPRCSLLFCTSSSWRCVSDVYESPRVGLPSMACSKLCGSSCGCVPCISNSGQYTLVVSANIPCKDYPALAWTHTHTHTHKHKHKNTHTHTHEHAHAGLQRRGTLWEPAMSGESIGLRIDLWDSSTRLEMLALLARTLPRSVQ